MADLDSLLTKKDLYVDDCALVYTMLMNLSADGSSMIEPLRQLSELDYYAKISSRAIAIKSSTLTQTKALIREFINELVKAPSVSELTSFLDTLDVQTPGTLGKLLGQKSKTIREQLFEKIISLAKDDPPYKAILVRESTSNVRPLSDFIYKLFIIYKGLTKCSTLCRNLQRDVPKLSEGNELRQHPLVADPKICNFLRDTIPLLTAVGTQAYSSSSRGGKTRRYKKSKKTRRH